jgi:hypothetical protein
VGGGGEGDVGFGSADLCTEEAGNAGGRKRSHCRACASRVAAGAAPDNFYFHMSNFLVKMFFFPALVKKNPTHNSIHNIFIMSRNPYKNGY